MEQHLRERRKEVLGWGHKSIAKYSFIQSWRLAAGREGDATIDQDFRIGQKWDLQVGLLGEGKAMCRITLTDGYLTGYAM